MGDDTNQTIKITLWGGLSEAKPQVGGILAIKGAAISNY